MKAKDENCIFVTNRFYTVSNPVTPHTDMGETIWTDSKKTQESGISQIVVIFLKIFNP